MIAEFAFVLALVTLGQAVESPRNARLARVCPKVDGYWTTFLRDVHNCRGYYKCSNGKAIWQRCPPGLFFHPRLLVCDIPLHTGCRIIRHLEEEVPQDESYVNEESAQVLNAAQDELDLDNLEEIAPQYEESLQGLSAADEEEDSDDLEEIASDDESYVDEDDLQNLDRPWRGYGPRLGWQCPLRDGRWPTFLPHRWNCSKYYECSNGKPILQRCPRGLRFNARKLVCDRRENVRCVVWNV